MTPNKSYCPRKLSSSILAGNYKNIEDNVACEASSSGQNLTLDTHHLIQRPLPSTGDSGTNRVLRARLLAARSTEPPHSPLRFCR